MSLWPQNTLFKDDGEDKMKKFENMHPNARLFFLQFSEGISRATVFDKNVFPSHFQAFYSLNFPIISF